MEELDLDWKLETEEGQSETGYLQTWRTEGQNQGYFYEILAVLHFFPVLPSTGNLSIANATLYWKSDSVALTKGFRRWVRGDIGKIARAYADGRFHAVDGELVQPLRNVMMQSFRVADLPVLEPLDHGDLSVTDV